MDQKRTIKFSLKTDVVIRRIFWCFLGIELLIVFLDVFVNHYQWCTVGSIRRMLNITREDSLSNWFSSLQAIMEPYEGIAGFFSTEDFRIMHMSKVLEEFFEMFGTTIFLTIFLKYLSRMSHEWKINIEGIS
ncbi:MAG: hypothetical protein ACE5GV_10210 [Candidatus Scalindua sp.]